MNFRRACRDTTLLFTLVACITGASAEERTSCPTGGPQDETQPLVESKFRKLFYNAGQKLQGYKTDEEIDAYVGCWKETAELHRLYLTKYKKLIQAAAAASGIPFSILACLYFYESKYNKNVVSPVGAKGMAQIMPGTWAQMVRNLDTKSAIVRNPYIVANLKKNIPSKGSATISKIVGKVDEFYKSKGKNGTISGKKNLETLRELLTKLSRFDDYADAASVEEYIANADAALEKHQTREIYDKYLKKIGKTNIAMDPFSAEAAAVMGAITLKVNLFQGVFGHKYRYPSHDRWVIAAGAYNSGAGGIKCDEKTTADECIKMTSIAETKKHMRGIRNCSESGNFKNKVDDEKKPGGCKA